MEEQQSENGKEIKERRSNDCLTINSPIVDGNAILVEECHDQLSAEQTWRLAM